MAKKDLEGEVIEGSTGNFEENKKLAYDQIREKTGFGGNYESLKDLREHFKTFEVKPHNHGRGVRINYTLLGKGNPEEDQKRSKVPGSAPKGPSYKI